MTQDPGAAFVVDADAFICLHSLSLLKLLSDRGVPQLIVTEYVARHELNDLAALVTAMEAAGQIVVRPVGARDPNFKRFRRDGIDKGEAEGVAWCLQLPRAGRPPFITNDRKARALAGREGVPAGDLLDFVVELVERAIVTIVEAEEKLTPWQDAEQQRCRPSNFSTLGQALKQRRSGR